MRLLFTLSFLSIALTILAQPSVTLDKVRPKIGDKYFGVFYDVTIKDYTAGSAGKDVTWDFSSLKDSLPNDIDGFLDTLGQDPVLTFEAIDPKNAINGDQFPMADLAILTRVKLFGDAEVYSFVQEADNGYLELGSVDILNVEFLGFEISDTSTTVNEIPELFIAYPITYQNTYTRSRSYREEDEFGTGVVTDVTEKETIEVDGYGTIITPFQTYDDALRLKITTETTNVQIFESTGMEVSTTTETFVSYNWYSNAQFAPILLYEVDGETNENDEEIASIFLYVPENFRIDPGTNTNERHLSELNLNVSPNPNLGDFQVNFELPASGQVQSALMTLNGRILQQNQPIVMEQGVNQVSFAVTDRLPNGTYLIQVMSDQFVGRQFVVINK